MLISIHALREEGDSLVRLYCSIRSDFYPRPPRGGRRLRGRIEELRKQFLSTPSARRATRRRQRGHTHAEISIHALREEGDVLSQGRFLAEESISIYALREEGDARKDPGAADRRISIHALREEGDPLKNASNCTSIIFLSTPSARRATQVQIPQTAGPRDFYPRPPRGGRRASQRRGKGGLYISIHALREEGDRHTRRFPSSFQGYFYPRPPRGGRPKAAPG